MRIRDPDSSDPGSGMKKSRIRDKHPGSATLQGTRIRITLIPNPAFLSLRCGSLSVSSLWMWIRIRLIIFIGFKSGSSSKRCNHWPIIDPPVLPCKPPRPLNCEPPRLQDVPSWLHCEPPQLQAFYLMGIRIRLFNLMRI